MTDDHKALAIQKQVIKTLGTEEVYLVGGSVRDIVMQNEPKDYDFTTPMLPDDVEEAVKASGRRAYAIGKKFGTIGFKVGYAHEGTFEMKDGRKQDGVGIKYEYVEVTTFRSEVYTSKSRKPEVQFVPSLEEDLARRDFTMNAMVLRPDGSIYDPYGGRIDMLKKQVVTVGLPKDRIQEDPLRMLRAARFAARYGFSIDPNFIGKARQLSDRIYDVSTERWVQELDKLLTSNHPHDGLLELLKMGLLTRILPEIMEANTSGRYILNQHTETISDNADEAWAFLLSHVHDEPKIARYINMGICSRLKFSNERTKKVLEFKKKLVK